MKHIVWKAFYDFEKEEIWLNEMSAKGMALSDYSWCRYVFQETPNSEYSYRVELLEYLPKHAESIAYLRFLEENGVECAAMYWRWVYLRKKTSEGAFELYSDIKSKINYYKRILLFWTTFMWLELIIGALNISVGLATIFTNHSLGDAPFINFIGGALLMLLGLYFYLLGSPIRKRVKKLKSEMLISE